MNRFLSAILMLCTIAAYTAPAQATREPRPIKVDHRVRTILYQEDQVYKYTGHYRYQTSIEFAPDEEIATISMGDSTGWLLNPLENRLFLKPIDRDATTNMTIITNKRVYLFELHARETDDINDDNLMFIMRFVYPDDQQNVGVTGFLDSVPVPDLETEADQYNFEYTIAGTDEIAPIRIFDDGEFTYFEFRDKNAEIPAFYWVDSRGDEAIVNFRTRGDYIVVERVASRFTLRHGRDIVCVFNESRLAGIRPPVVDRNAPDI
jgi:type IV secretion system protein VirB9